MNLKSLTVSFALALTCAATVVPAFAQDYQGDPRDDDRNSYQDEDRGDYQDRDDRDRPREAYQANDRDAYRDDRRHDDRGCRNCGRVRSIERLAKRDKHLGGGTVLGAIVGGALGNQVGKGDGRKAATIVGAVAGGAVGHGVETNNRNSRVSYRISVRMDDGRVRDYEQYDAYGLRSGDPVFVSDGGVVQPRR